MIGRKLLLIGRKAIKVADHLDQQEPLSEKRG
jgi:hypothetical protein